MRISRSWVKLLKKSVVGLCYHVPHPSHERTGHEHADSATWMIDGDERRDLNAEPALTG